MVSPMQRNPRRAGMSLVEVVVAACVLMGVRFVIDRWYED